MSDQPSTISLNVTDISDVVKVIDHACDQGAFRGWDNFRQIVALRDRLDTFVKATTDNPNTMNLNLADILDAIKVIDHACEQGAFRGWDNIRQVIGLRDRMVSFMNTTVAIENDNAKEPVPAE